MEHPFIRNLLSILCILAHCCQSFRSDLEISCHAPNISTLIISSIAYKVEKMFECMGVLKRCFRSKKAFKRSENSKNNSVEKDRSAWLDDTMDKKLAIAYIDILRRSNCNSLMLLLNSYWAHSAFQFGPLDHPKILEATKKIKINATSILRTCEAYHPNHVCLKRGHQNPDSLDRKRQKIF